MNATITSIRRYPVKGLSAQDLPEVDLSPGLGLPEDRRFALIHGASTFDPNAQEWRPKTNFLMLARHERLAALATDYDAETATLTVSRAGKAVARGRIDTPTGRAIIEQFFAAYMAGAAPGVPRLVEAPGHMFSDTKVKCVSIINAASVRDIERLVQAPVDPLRFRGNLLIEGVPAWTEAGWIGRTLAIGAVRLEVYAAIDRCAATNVNPTTAERDLNLPKTLQNARGNIDCGVYARVVSGGCIQAGAVLTVSDG